MASKDNLKNVKSKMAKSGNLLGDLVWWSLRDIDISPDRMRKLVQAAGVDENLLPADPNDEHYIRKAVSRHRSGDGSGFFLRKIVKDDDRVVYGVISAEVVTGGKGTGAKLAKTSTLAPEDLEMGLVDKVILDRKAGKVESLTNHPLALKVIGTFNELHGSYTTKHIAQFIFGALDQALALPVRESGGVYFVPESTVDQVRSLANVINHVNNSVFSTLPIHNDEAGHLAVTDPAQISLENEVRKVMQGLQKINIEDVSARKLETRIAQFQDLETKANFYSGIMDVTVKDMLKSLGDTKKVLAKQMGITSEKEEQARSESKESRKAKRKEYRAKKRAEGIANGTIKPKEPKAKKAKAEKKAKTAPKSTAKKTTKKADAQASA